MGRGGGVRVLGKFLRGLVWDIVWMILFIEIRRV